MSEKDMTNFERLVAAGVLDDKYFTTDAEKKPINDIKLSDEEIKILKDFKEKLNLDPLLLKPGPGFKVFGSL
jgi:hypothetical protein